MSAKAVSKGILSVGGWSMAKLATSAVVLPILARFLGIEGYGQYAYYLAVLLLASQFANVGMMQTMTRRIAERPEDGPWCRAVARSGALINGAGVVAVGIAAGLLIGGTASHDATAGPIALTVLGVLVFDQVWFYARGVLHGFRHEERAAVPGIIGVLMAGSVGILAAVTGMGVVGVFGGLLVADIFVAVACLRAVTSALNGLGFPASEKSSTLSTGAMLRFGLSAMTFSVLNMALCSLDIILVRHLAGEAQAGLYAAAVQWSQFVWFIPIAVEGVMLQATAKIWAEERVAAVTDLVSRLVRYVMLGTIFLLIVVFVLGDRIITVYFGPHFSEATLGLRLLVPGALCYALARVLWPVIQAGGQGMSLIRVMLVAVLVDAGLCTILIPVSGAAGAACATSLSFALVAGGYAWILRRRNVGIFEGLALSRVVVLVGITGVVMAGLSALVSTPLLSLLVGVAVGAVLYWAGVFSLGIVQVNELESLVQSLPGTFRRVGEMVFQLVAPWLLRLKAAASN
ncbi:MAG: lipopolysaccharide biosynthesis protein [Nitrospira sp. NTP1]|nr:lipopolysaccharide biosynthesis protein [Nitrospira sp. NTP1]